MIREVLVMDRGKARELRGEGFRVAWLGMEAGPGPGFDPVIVLQQLPGQGDQAEEAQDPP
jgi:hypothetical protein